MHAVKLLHKQLQLACPFIHSKHLTALIDASQALSEDQHLSVTGIGRALNNRTTPKHNIKRIDRLVGNAFLQSERSAIYKAISAWLLSRQTNPIVLVDWSDLTSDREQQLLRASIPVSGRSLTIYEEVHPLKGYANRKVHHTFLNRLKQLLPDNISPIIVTDAGFRGTWFKLVNQFSWHWVGRVRNRDFICFSRDGDWKPCKTLYQQATHTPKALGAALLSRREPNEVTLHLVKKTKKHRVAKSKFGQRVHNARTNKISAREREPWLLATSPSLGHLTAQQVVNIYQKRMQIEEGFRDIKCERFGLGLSDSLTKNARRLEILLLLGALALIVLWMTGMSAIQQKIHHQYQSNTIRHRSVLSSIFLGMQIMRYDPTMFRKRELLEVFTLLPKETEHVV